MAKASGSIRSVARRSGLSVTRLTGSRRGSQGYRYAIRGDGGRTNIRARTAAEGVRLIRAQRQFERQAAQRRAGGG